MDTNGKVHSTDKNGCKDEPVTNVDLKKAELNGGIEKDDETESLLPPRKGGLSKHSGKPRQKVQWNDTNGNKLAEVLEYQPSDVSDSDDEESDACICSIM